MAKNMTDALHDEFLEDLNSMKKSESQIDREYKVSIFKETAFGDCCQDCFTPLFGGAIQNEFAQGVTFKPGDKIYPIIDGILDHIIDEMSSRLPEMICHGLEKSIAQCINEYILTWDDQGALLDYFIDKYGVAH